MARLYHETGASLSLQPGTSAFEGRQPQHGGAEAWYSYLSVSGLLNIVEACAFVDIMLLLSRTIFSYPSNPSSAMFRDA